MSDHSNSSYPTAAGRGWIPGSRDIGLPGESFPRGRGGRSAEGDPGFRRDDEEGGASACDAWPDEALGEGAPGRRGAAERGGEREVGGPRTSLSSSLAPDVSPVAGHDPSFRASTSLGLAVSGDGLPLPRREEQGWSPARKVRFLDRLSGKGDVRAAAAAVGMSRQSAYLLRRRDRVFARGWDAALVLARRHVEDVLATRALDGVEEPVFYHGEQVAVRRRYDARLLLAHLGRLDRLVEADAAGSGERGGDLAERFDEVLAVVAGEAPAELFEVAPVRAGRPEPVLPPSREVYADRAGVMLQDEADAAWEQAVAAGEAGPEDEPDPRVALWREAAAGEWDGWRRRAEGAVDAVLGGEGVPPMEFKSVGGGFSCSGQCKACQPERRREPDAGCDVMMGEGRRGASPTPSVTASAFPVSGPVYGPASGIFADYSSLASSERTASSTLPEPMRAMPISFAAASERSITRLEWNGPRSLMRTMTESPVSALVTRSFVPKGSEGWAAVRSSGLKRSPLAVRAPRSEWP